MRTQQPLHPLARALQLIDMRLLLLQHESLGIIVLPVAVHVTQAEHVLLCLSCALPRLRCRQRRLCLPLGSAERFGRGEPARVEPVR